MIMDETEETHKIYFFLLIVVLVILGIISTLFLWRESVSSKVARDIAELKKDGYPVTLKELDDFYTKVPESENAALLYEEAASKLIKLDIIDNWQEDKKELLNNNTPISSEAIEEFSAYLADNKNVIDLLEEASLLEKNRYTTNFTDIFEATLPELGGLRDSEHLLSVKLYFDIKNKKYSDIGAVDLLGAPRVSPA